MTKDQDPSVLDRVRYVCFDCFGTLLDMSGVDRDVLRSYADHVHGYASGESRNYARFTFPPEFAGLRAHPDVAQGLRRIRSKHHVVAFSNCPLPLMMTISKANGIEWDGIVPLQMAYVWKPHRLAYQELQDVLDCEPADILIVTANETFGDLQNAAKFGMQSAWIRGESDLKDTMALADYLGCE